MLYIFRRADASSNARLQEKEIGSIGSQLHPKHTTITAKIGSLEINIMLKLYGKVIPECRNSRTSKLSSLDSLVYNIGFLSHNTSATRLISRDWTAPDVEDVHGRPVVCLGNGII